MEYRRLGNTGLTVSRICLGCMSYGDPAATIAGSNLRWEWALKEEAARPFFKRAIELGINFFDTANVYSFGASEEITGRALREFARREEVVIATKVWGVMRPGPNGGGLSRKAILHEIDASLKRLGTDYAAWLPEWKASGLSQLRAPAERRPCGGLLAKTSRSARPRSQSHPTDIVIEISAMNLGRLSGASAVPCCM